MQAQEFTCNSGPVATDKRLSVFYDGSCPLCTREVAFYRRRAGADEIEWIDVDAIDCAEVAPGLTKSEALARFHVRDTDGRLVSGARAFARLWAALPSFRPLAWLARPAPIAWGLEIAYRGFLRLRPRLQRLVAETDNSTGDRALEAWLIRELRSDHAGETGAIAIYRGILATTRDPDVRSFAQAHIETERRHLQLIEEFLPAAERSRLLPLWQLAGFVTGAVPALTGPNAIYATIESVETFVDTHYAAQIARLEAEDSHPNLLAVLRRCRLDEVRHRDEAQAARERAVKWPTAAWCRLVAAGSGAAVSLARRL